MYFPYFMTSIRGWGDSKGHFIILSLSYRWQPVKVLCNCLVSPKTYLQFLSRTFCPKNHPKMVHPDPEFHVFIAPSDGQGGGAKSHQAKMPENLRVHFGLNRLGGQLWGGACWPNSQHGGDRGGGATSQGKAVGIEGRNPNKKPTPVVVHCKRTPILMLILKKTNKRGVAVTISAPALQLGGGVPLAEAEYFPRNFLNISKLGGFLDEFDSWVHCTPNFSSSNPTSCIEETGSACEHQ